MDTLLQHGRKQAAAENSVYWRVIDKIIKGIKTRKYKPGTQIPTEKELMDEMGISRGSVREAIKALSALGIVTIRRGDGTYISQAEEIPPMDSVVYALLMANASLEDVLDFRFHVENMLLRVAADKVTPEDIRELESIIDQAQVAYEQNDIARVQELDMIFHMQVLEYTRNPFFIRMVSAVYEFAGREIISKNPNIGPYYLMSKESHLDDIKYLKTKDSSYIDKDTKYDRSKIWFEYYSEKTPE